MKAPSLLLTLAVFHASVWSAGVFAVLTFISMGGAFGAVVVWVGAVAAFGVILAAHLVVARMIRNRMKART